MLSAGTNRGSVAAPSVDLATVAGLAPCQRLSTAIQQQLLERSETLHLAPGLLHERLPQGRQCFLLAGSLQIQTANGTMLLLRAGTAQARFPLPAARAMVSLLATEPCTLLTMPRLRRRRQAPAPGSGPSLSPDEQEALQLLRGFLHSSQCELPALPDLALKIGRAIDDAETTNQDVARLIQIDPALSARILSVVNSAAFGAMGKISSIAQATGRLGRSKVRSLVYSCLLRSLFSVDFPGLKRRMEALWQHSAEVAALSFVLSRETPGTDPEQALLAGLVHDIGSLAVICGVGRFPVLAGRDEVLDFALAELRVESGLRILEQWGLEDELGDVVRDAEDWGRVGSAVAETADVVILAQMHALIGSPAQPRLPRIDQVPAFAKLARGRLSPRLSLELLDQASGDVREVRALISTD